jgi:hypothetical protein
MLSAVETMGEEPELRSACCNQCGTSGIDFSVGDC